MLKVPHVIFVCWMLVAYKEHWPPCAYLCSPWHMQTPPACSFSCNLGRIKPPTCFSEFFRASHLARCCVTRSEKKRKRPVILLSATDSVNSKQQQSQPLPGWVSSEAGLAPSLDSKSDFATLPVSFTTGPLLGVGVFVRSTAVVDTRPRRCCCCHSTAPWHPLHPVREEAHVQRRCLVLKSVSSGHIIFCPLSCLPFYPSPTTPYNSIFSYFFLCCPVAPVMR